MVPRMLQERHYYILTLQYLKDFVWILDSINPHMIIDLLEDFDIVDCNGLAKNIWSIFYSVGKIIL